jgi:serine/threonine protein kinase
MSRIGRYVLQGEIGRGAMGVVYLAHDPRLQRRVAVKTYILPDGISEELIAEFHERFLREAQAAASLSHPGIVTIYDAGDDASLGLSYIAMEYVPGRSLRQVLEQGDRLEPGWVMNFGTVLADALHVAHQAGIIHRDIKPANILLRAPDGAAKIADFGVARLSTSELTQSGASLGSPAYMSPEQFRGGALDGRSDLFSLAAVLYEALCGQRPFEGKDLPALVYSIAHDAPVPITRRVRGFPERLDDFFDQALAKDPGKRFKNGADFRDAFREAGRKRRASGPAATPDSPGKQGGRSASAPPGVKEPASARRKPKKGGSFLGLKFGAAAIFSLLLMATGYFYLSRPAHLKLDARSSIGAGTLSLRVDGREVYSRNLLAPPARKGVLNKILGRDQESFEGWIRLSPGKHEVAARVLPEGASSPFQDSIVVDLKSGETRTLRMIAGRSLGAPVSLKMD